MKPREVKGLVCYYLHQARDGSILTALYRPVKGPWTPGLRKLVPTACQGIALETEVSAIEPGEIQRPSLIRTELKARQGSLAL